MTRLITFLALVASLLLATPAQADVVTDPAVVPLVPLCTDPAVAPSTDPGVVSPDCANPLKPHREVVGPGVKPRRVFDRDRKRSCRSEAKVFERVQIIVWVLSEDYHQGVIFKHWSPQRFTDGWSRVLPTPYGCKLNHRAWVRKHGGRR
jgi:hypothetical protein